MNYLSSIAFILTGIFTVLCVIFVIQSIKALKNNLPEKLRKAGKMLIVFSLLGAISAMANTVIGDIIDNFFLIAEGSFFAEALRALNRNIAFFIVCVCGIIFVKKSSQMEQQQSTEEKE